MRAVTYVAVSTLLAVGLTLLAFIERPNYYASGVAIEQSAATILALTNMVVIFVIFLAKCFIYLSFGPLRSGERQTLLSNLSFALTESFFTMSMRRAEIDANFGIFFILYMFLKVFHWISSERVDTMFQTQLTRFNHARMLIVVSLLTYVDYQLVKYAVRAAMVMPLPMVMFACQFGVLFITAVNCLAKFILNWKEARYLRQNEEEDVWEPKNLYVVVISLITDVLKLAFYFLMFTFLLSPTSIPSYSIGEVFFTFRSLIARSSEYRRILRAKAKLDKDIGKASAADLERDSLCVICREEMSLDAGTRSSRLVPKKLPCNHVIHYGCLKNWLERSQHCPTCRRSVFVDRSSSNRSGDATAAPGSTTAPTVSTTSSETSTSTSTGTSTATSRVPFGVDGSSGDSNGLSGEVSPTVTQTDEISVDSAHLRLPPRWKAFRATPQDDGSLSIALNSNRFVRLRAEREPSTSPLVSSSSTGGGNMI